MSWNDPPLAEQNGLIRQYLISINELDTGNVYTYSSLTNEFNAMFLHPYYYYNCSVSAVTVASGPFSYSVSIQTAIDGKLLLDLSRDVLSYYNALHF